MSATSSSSDAMPRSSITEKLSDLKQAAKRAAKKVKEANLAEAQRASQDPNKATNLPACPIQCQFSMH
uniref:Guanine nucleotide-binding protein subunit gamma n=1 Tax=Steinernema glaseri TaxID=37863 RepID=A0A1I7YZZ7_9BILA